MAEAVADILTVYSVVEDVARYSRKSSRVALIQDGRPTVSLDG